MIAGNPIMVGGKKPSGSINVTANGTYDVTEKASAVVNVVSAPVLLWTNASPSSAFTARTVSFDDSYDGFLIETMERYWSTELYAVSFLNAPLNNTFAGGAGKTGNSSTLWYRVITSVSGNAITFGSGCYASGEYYSDGTHAKPTRIWGVHFTVV